MAESQELHSPMGPSSIERRELCPGSLAAEEGMPDPESEDAREGKLLHDVVAGLIRGIEVDTIRAGKNAFAVEACLGVASRIQDDYRQKENVSTFVEERVDIAFVHKAMGFGTLDLGVAAPFDCGVVVDWKFGRADVTPARENRQVWSYVCGWRRRFELEKVTGMVVCPMTGRFSEYTFSSDEIDDIERHLCRVTAACLLPWAPRFPSPKACAYCNAKTVCTALMLPVEEFRKAAAGRMPDTLVPSEVDKLLGLSKTVEKWIKAVHGQAYKVLNAGGSIPGWGLKSGRALRHWNEGVTEEQLVALAAALGKKAENLSTKELITPAQLEQIWGKAKAVVEAMKPLVFKKPGELKLARIGESAEKSA